MRKVGIAILAVVALCLSPAAAKDLTTRAGIAAEYRHAKAMADVGFVQEAIADYEMLLAAAQQLSPPDLVVVGHLQDELADLMKKAGNRRREGELRYAAADSYRQALPPTDSRIALADFALAHGALNYGYVEEVADIFWRAIAAADTAVGGAAPMLRWMARGSLGKVFVEQEQPREALVLLEQSLAIADATLPPEMRGNSLFCGYRQYLGEAQIKLRQYAEAEAALREARACRERDRQRDTDDVEPSVFLALTLARQGRTEEAMELARQAVAIIAPTLAEPKDRVWHGYILALAARVAFEAGELQAAFKWIYDRAPLIEALGRDRLEWAELVIDGAEYWFGADDVQQSSTYARWALDTLKTRAARVAAGARGSDEGERRRIRVLASRMVEMMAATPATRKGREQLWTDNLLQIAQVAHATAAGQAIAQMAGRISVGNDALAGLLAERRDAASTWSRTDRALTVAVEQSVTGAELDEIRRARDMAGANLAEIDRRLAADFPQAARHAGFTILTAAEIQALLRPDEAILFYLIGEKRSAVWTIAPEDVRMTTLAIGEAELEGMVAELRSGVDPARVRGVKDLPVFDVELARMLYQRLVRPIGNRVSYAAPKARHLMIVADGPLHALPFQILIAGDYTEKPDAARLAEAHWFAKDYAISTLPSIAALAALRSQAGASRATKPFLGVGDPLLGDRAGAARGADLAFADDDASWLRGARGVGAEGALDRLYRGGRADIEALRQLPSLPDTALELAALAQSLKAPDESLRLRETAREATLRQRNALKDYRVLAFATHGVTAGEIRGAAEPGLVLTPPEEASEADDGLLTAGEVAGLDLDADWVVLSACNTAAGDGQPGAQGLSGLARAFFLAGSRSLLVSHWPVFSKPAVRLTTGMMARLEAEPGLARAEAQRQAMLEMIADTERPFLAHPVFWAPFSVVGEGGSLQRR